MKLIVGLAAVLGVAVGDSCDHDAETKCLSDIQAAYPICENAAKEKGQDIPADLECMKYFATVEKDCWPCICQVAEAQGWKIKGCSSLRIFRN